MFFDDFSKIDEDLFDTVLDEDFHFEGVIKNTTSLIVKGNIIGKIHSDNLLILGPNALIEGDIYTKNLQCFGKVKGNIFVEEDAYFYIKSEINGNITTNLITIEKGSIINGLIKMDNNNSLEEDTKKLKEDNKKEDNKKEEIKEKSIEYIYNEKNGFDKSNSIDNVGVNNNFKKM